VETKSRPTSQLSWILDRQYVAAFEVYERVLFVIATYLHMCVSSSSNGQVSVIRAVMKLFTSNSLQKVNLRNTSLVFSE